MRRLLFVLSLFLVSGGDNSSTEKLKAEFQYGAIIDAGSSSSRLAIFE